MGIKLKSNQRTKRAENGQVTLFDHTRKIDDRDKLLDACKGFNAEPWIAVYVETETYAELFLTSLENYDKRYNKKSKNLDVWLLSLSSRLVYEDDPCIKYVRIDYSGRNWV